MTGVQTCALPIFSLFYLLVSLFYLLVSLFYLLVSLFYLLVSLFYHGFFISSLSITSKDYLSIS